MAEESGAGAPAPPRLLKHKSWSPDAHRDEAWLRRKQESRLRRCESVTDDDLEELRGCIELGFAFDSDSPDLVPKLARTLPAIELYCAVNRNYSRSLSRSSSSSTIASSSDSDTTSCLPANPPAGSIFDLEKGDEPEMVKARLRQWAQMVACSVKQNLPIQ